VLLRAQIKRSIKTGVSRLRPPVRNSTDDARAGLVRSFGYALIYYVIAAAVVVTVASAITMHFFPNMTMHVQPPAMTGAPAQPGSCPSGAKWCQDLGGLPE
jgi:hypothetical protein